MKKNDRPTPRQKKFVHEYLKNGFNATDAYRIVYNPKNDKSCESNSSRLIRNDKVKKYINGYLNELFSDNYNLLKYNVIEKWKMIANDDKHPHQSKALNMLARYLNMYDRDEKLEVKPPVEINFNFESDITKDAVKNW